MKRTATLEAVTEVANSLQASGYEPSIINVQAQVGGSFTTIKRLLEQWRAENAAPQQEAPAEVERQAVAFARQTWALLSKQASDEIQRGRELAAAEVRAARDELDQATAELARLEGIEEEQRQEISALRDQHTSISSLLAAATAKLERLDTLEASLSAANTEIERLRKIELAATGLQAENELLRQQLSTIIPLTKKH